MVHNTDSSKKIQLPDAQATDLFAERLARACQGLLKTRPGLVIYLEGDLGSGKTSLCRRFIQYFIANARVKSPTYTLVESYAADNLNIHHFDLYRLCDPGELEFLGIRELLIGKTIALIEWPQQGQGFLPEPDLVLRWRFLEQGRELELHTKHPEVGKMLDGLWA